MINLKLFLLFIVSTLQVAVASETSSGHHGHPTFVDLKINIINFFIYAFLIGKYVVPKLAAQFKETREKISEGLKTSKKKMDEAQARLADSEKLVAGLDTKLSEVELNAKRDIEHYKERSTRETNERIETMEAELKNRLELEESNFRKRLNNETAIKLVHLSKEKIIQDTAVSKKVNELSIELLGN
ncbi:MAG: ATP synthase F0 subunit B [Bacteriovoracaceae bacterium]|nr:ATP synthase F0 subunit B [Bacteriovoracaceae bacterium]